MTRKKRGEFWIAVNERLCGDFVVSDTAPSPSMRRRARNASWERRLMSTLRVERARHGVSLQHSVSSSVRTGTIYKEQNQWADIFGTTHPSAVIDVSARRDRG